MQTLNKISESLQKLLSRKEKCDDDNADGQHDPYMSAMPGDAIKVSFHM